MTSTTGEAVLMGVFTALCLLATVVQARKRDWGNVLVYGIPMLFGLFITIAAAHGVLFVGPGGQGGVSVP